MANNKKKDFTPTIRTDTIRPLMPMPPLDVPPEFDDPVSASRLMVGSIQSYIVNKGISWLMKQEKFSVENMCEAIGIEVDEATREKLTKAQDSFSDAGASNPGIQRTYHALKRLKEKNLAAENTMELRDRMGSLKFKTDDGETPFSFADIALFGIPDSLDDRYFSIPVDNDIWLRAIELTMLVNQPNEYADTDVRFAPFIEHNLAMIYLLAYQLAYAKFVSEENQAYSDKVGDIEKMAEKDKRIAELEKALEAATRRADAMSARASELTAEKELLKRTSDKRINELEHDLKDMETEKDKEIEFFCRQNARLLGLSNPEQDAKEDAEDEKNFQFEDGDAEEDIEEFAHELPDKGVLFLGGHVNLVKKLRPLHPNWRYQSDNQFNTANTSIKLVFMWNNHMSHSLEEKVFSVISKDIPVLYLTATNLNRLEHEMKLRYNDYIEKGIYC